MFRVVCSLSPIYKKLPVLTLCSQQLQVQPKRNEITYQADIEIHNIDEITRLMSVDPARYETWSSLNILKANTLYADRPWWSARDESGKLLGFILASLVGDSYVTGAQLYVSPEYRGREIGIRLHEVSFNPLLATYPPRSLINFFERGRSAERVNYTCTPGLIVDFQMPTKIGEIDYDSGSGLLKKDGEGFHIEKLKPGWLFDKMVRFDTGVIHEVPRAVFLKQALTGATTYIAINNLTGHAEGYGSIQHSYREDSLIISPLYALWDDIASVILHHLLLEVKQGQQVLMTYSADNKFICDVADNLFGSNTEYVFDHFHYGKYSVPFKRDFVYCRMNSGVVLA